MPPRNGTASLIDKKIQILSTELARAQAAQRKVENKLKVTNTKGLRDSRNKLQQTVAHTKAELDKQTNAKQKLVAKVQKANGTSTRMGGGRGGPLFDRVAAIVRDARRAAAMAALMAVATAAAPVASVARRGDLKNGVEFEAVVFTKRPVSENYLFTLDDPDAEIEVRVKLADDKLLGGEIDFDEKDKEALRRHAPDVLSVVDYLARCIKTHRTPFADANNRNRAGRASDFADGQFAATRRKFFENLVRRLGPGNSKGVGWGGDSRAAWAEVRTFQELMLMNTFFLRGMTQGAPYHDSKICSDSRNIVGKDLLLVNSRGFLTYDGQPPSIENEFREPDGSFSAEQQKSYLDGFLPKHHLNGFRAFMARKRDVAYAFVRSTTTDTILLNIFPKLPRPFYPVTRIRQAPTKNALANAAWETTTSTPLMAAYDVAKHTFQGYPEIAGILERGCVCVSMAGTEFGGRPTMEAVMLEYLDTPEAMKLSAAYRFA